MSLRGDYPNGMPTMEQGTSESAAAATFRRILVPVSLRMPSHRAIQVAGELRRRFGGLVCVFHVVSSDENDHFLSGLGSPTTRSDLRAEGSDELRQFVHDVAFFGNVVPQYGHCFVSQLISCV